MGRSSTTWQPGQSGNPKGGVVSRPSQSRKHLSRKFIRTLAYMWEEHGDKVLERVIAEEPATFLKVVASVIPKDVQIEGDGNITVKIVRHVADIEGELVTPLLEDDARQH